MSNTVHCLLLIVFAGVAFAADPVIPESSSAKALAEKPEPKADKSQYHLFKPVPKDLMRELSTDRPDKTESAYTVDAGHFQIEWDLFSFERDRNNPDDDFTKVDSYSFASPNFKMGLTNRIDIQFVFQPQIIENTRSRDEDGVVFHETKQGCGDLTVRTKFNIFGNDGGGKAFALMPFVSFPTNQEELGSEGVEFGLIAPFNMDLPCGWAMGVMTEFDAVRDDGDTGYDVDFFNTITFGHDIIGDLGGYLEFASTVHSNGDAWEGTVDFGFTYGFTENIQLDWGCNVGVTRSAPDVNPFLGLTVRW
jgi:hypothetical protein